MERIVAIKKLGKLLGKGFGYRINPRAPDREERLAARDELVPAKAEEEALREKLRKRKEELLQDKEYQDLSVAWKVADKRVANLRGKLHSFKFTVGDTSSGLFFMVKAEGDSWEEVIAKVEAKDKAKAA